MNVSLSNEVYLKFFSYMPAGKATQFGEWEYRAFKATAYIPIFGTISCLFLSVIGFYMSGQKKNAQKKEVCGMHAAYFGLRAALTLTPPLLFVVESITTLVHAMLLSKNYPKVGLENL
ncbi:MAG: hypothetical protein ACSNEK_03675 [Parachlamydiaceae bacterium]